MNNIEYEVIVLSEKNLSYTLIRKNVKNINLRITRDGKVIVSAHYNIDKAVVHSFVESKLHWIFKKIAEQEKIVKQQYYISGENIYILGQLKKVIFSPDIIGTYFSNDIIYIYTNDVSNAEENKKAYLKYEQKICNQVFNRLNDDIFKTYFKFLKTKPIITFRNMKSKYASCNINSYVIDLNRKLIHIPIDYITAVLIHEYVHFIHPNHSKSFYTYLLSILPDYKTKQKILNKWI